MTAFFLAAWAWCAAPSARAIYTEHLIHIGILREVSHLALKPEGRFALRDESAGTLRDLPEGKAYRVEVEGDGLRFGPYHAAGAVRLTPLEDGALLATGGRRY